MKRSHIFGGVVAIVSLLAASCSTPADEEASPAEAATNFCSTATTDQTPLLSPTETADAFDTSGGVQTGNGTAEVDNTSDHFSKLDSRVAQAPNWSTDWSRATIDTSEIFSGGPPKDGIPPIDTPKFETTTQACDWLAANEPGAVVEIDGEARFYPLGILTKHEIVNDRFGDTPVAVTFCPLCNTAISFDRRVDNEVRRFGVSGFLRKSDMVMWDDKTDSLWQQVTGEAIVGDAAGTELEKIGTAISSFDQFAKNFPEGLSLSKETGLRGSYGTNPYDGYSSRDTPIPQFFDGEIDSRLPGLERVVGVEIDGQHKAYPFSTLPIGSVVNDTIEEQPVVVWREGTTADALDKGTIAESESIGTAVAFAAVVDGQELTFTSNSDGTFTDEQTESTWNVLGKATDGELVGEQLELLIHSNEFWFAWSAFFPDGELYQA